MNNRDNLDDSGTHNASKTWKSRRTQIGPVYHEWIVMDPIEIINTQFAHQARQFHTTPESAETPSTISTREMHSQDRVLVPTEEMPLPWHSARTHLRWRKRTSSISVQLSSDTRQSEQMRTMRAQLIWTSGDIDSRPCKKGTIHQIPCIREVCDQRLIRKKDRFWRTCQKN